MKSPTLLNEIKDCGVYFRRERQNVLSEPPLFFFLLFSLYEPHPPFRQPSNHKPSWRYYRTRTKRRFSYFIKGPDRFLRSSWRPLRCQPTDLPTTEWTIFISQAPSSATLPVFVESPDYHSSPQTTVCVQSCVPSVRCVDRHSVLSSARPQEKSLTIDPWSSRVFQFLSAVPLSPFLDPVPCREMNPPVPPSISSSGQLFRPSCGSLPSCPTKYPSPSWSFPHRPVVPVPATPAFWWTTPPLLQSPPKLLRQDHVPIGLWLLRLTNLTPCAWIPYPFPSPLRKSNVSTVTSPNWKTRPPQIHTDTELLSFHHFLFYAFSPSRCWLVLHFRPLFSTVLGTEGSTPLFTSVVCGKGIYWRDNRVCSGLRCLQWTTSTSNLITYDFNLKYNMSKQVICGRTTMIVGVCTPSRSE